MLSLTARLRTIPPSKIIFKSLSRRDRPSPREREVIDFVNGVREQNISICESVQRSLHSRDYSEGKLIAGPERTCVSEHAVHDFQRKIAAAPEV